MYKYITNLEKALQSLEVINKCPYVGLDIDPNGIYSGSDGAISRYQDFKKKFPNANIIWITGDEDRKEKYNSFS